MESRIIELEIKLAHQENAIEELNKVVYQQQRDLEALEAKLVAIVERWKDFDAGNDIGPGNEKPPHY